MTEPRAKSAARLRPRCWCWIVVAGGLGWLSLIGGCSSHDPRGRHAVEGTVAVDGEPIKIGSINFQAQQTSGTSSGGIIRDGRYSIPADKGLTVGRYKVMIFATKEGTGETAKVMPGDPMPPPAELIPAEYNVNSDKFIEVTEQGPYEFSFEIATKK